MDLATLIRQDEFASPAQEAVLNVLATQSWITGELAAVLGPYGVTPTQYNALRILRGVHPKPYTCSDIADRLLDRTPDVTRLLCRLEREGLVDRTRSEQDRRVVEVSITKKGLSLLNRLDQPMEATMHRLSRHLAAGDLETLSRLLDAMRTDQT